jgi:hypothetical protein
MVKNDRPQIVQGSAPLSCAGWRQRIALVHPYLENSKYWDAAAESDH